LCFVAGFLLSIYGLTDSSPRLVNAGLALLVTGIAATAASIYQQVKARRADRR
jgi:hypothetical protein